MKLIALDLDGTLFNNESLISDYNKQVIEKASLMGVKVVISTGRPFCGLPFDAIRDTKIEYAITANGSAIYHIPTKKCLFEDCIDDSIAISLIDYLSKKKVHLDTFIDGQGYSTYKCLEYTKQLLLPPSILKYIIDTRKRVDNIADFIAQNEYHIQKITLNFPVDKSNNYYCRDEVYNYLSSIREINVVSGGYGNLEFTKSGIDKGSSLLRLAAFLNIPIEQTMAIGDTENDISIIRTANVGVAMGNATDEVKSYADYITETNENDGVAKAIEHFLSI